MDLVTARYRHARRPGASQVRDGDYFALGGGLNLEDSPLLVKPGQLLACKNYEPKPGSGYARIRGFERFDGRTAPSKAPYFILQYVRAAAVPPVNVTVTGQQSGATGVIAAVAQDVSISTINLLKRSEEFSDTSAWTHLDMTVSDNGITSPIDGSPTAVFLAETAANTEHSVLQVAPKDATARMYWYSCYVRPRGGTSHGAIRAFFSVSKAEIIFDFSIGAAGAYTQNGDFIGLDEYMLQMADGWWRLGIKFTSSTQNRVSCMLLSAAPGGILTYPGDPSRGLEVVGAQLEETTADSAAPSAYVRTDAHVRGNGAGHLVLVRTSGTFVDGERLRTPQLVNAGFETGDLSGWNGNTDLGTVVTGAARTGTFCARLESSAGGPNLFQWLDVAAGDVVDLSVWVKRDESSLPSAGIRLRARAMNKDLVEIASATLQTADFNTSGYQFLSGQYPVPASTAYLLFDIGESAGTGHWFIDDANATVILSEADGTATQNNAATDALDTEYRKTARALARLEIAKPGGNQDGGVSGVAIYKGVGYCLRDTPGGTFLLKSSASGWLAINTGRKLRFDAGQAAGIAEGDTITGGSSAHEATVRRVVVQTGSFAANDAAGYIIIPEQLSFQDNEALNVGGTLRATANGAAALQTLSPGGQLKSRVHNFYGHSATERLYGVDGINRAFEYQDSPEFFCQIETGMTSDAPTHVAVHQEQLFLSFSGGSLQKSSVGDPVLWLVTLGAGELAVGAEITALLEEIGDTLFIFTRNKTRYLAGTVTDYALKNFESGTGAIEGTVQRIGMGVYLDDRGFTSLSATQRFGNYAANSFSSKVQGLIDELKDTGAISSCVVKGKNLYRCFFSDGRFVSIGMEGGKVTGITTSDLGMVVSCVESGEDAEGKEMILFGSTDGFVYRMESGPSADGEPIEAFLRTAFHFTQSPQLRKRYRRALFQVRTSGKCTLKISADYSFANPDEAIESIRDVQLDGGGGLWNVAQWNEFKWNTGLAGEASIKLEASGTNIGFLLAHSADDEEEHSIDSVVLRQSIRRPERGAKHG